MLKESTSAVEADHRIAIPVRLQAISQVGMEAGTGSRVVLLVTVARPGRARIRLRHKPVPVE